ncbi:MAG: hypothetical protein LBO66_14185 [Deltaproteobacteria bacterium]|jgi:hypothetical protein|nr:hypothetical protein [Deltaproteobacteria bacterium]
MNAMKENGAREGAARGRFKGRRETLSLWLLALIVAISLAGPEASVEGEARIYTQDHLNHVKLAQSAWGEIAAGRVPPRIATGIDPVPGNPYHQFYAPLSHSAAGFLGFLAQDSGQGVALAVVLALAIGFVYAFKLGKYLTRSGAIGLVLAFAFVCAPYLAVTRVIHGSLAEFWAMAASPLIVYCLLRAIAGRVPFYLAAGALSLAALYLLHILTAVYLIFFFSFFLLARFFFAALARPRSPRLLAKLFKRLLAFGAINLVSIGLCAYYFFPIILNGDIMASHLPGDVFLRLSQRCVSFLTLTSVRDLLPVNPADFSDGRFQLGIVHLSGALAFIFFHWRKTNATSARALIATLVALFLIILFPVIIADIPYLNALQFSFRLLFEFQFLAAIALALALKEVAARFRLSPASAKALAALLIAVVILQNGDYLGKGPYREGFPILQGEKAIRAAAFNPYSVYAYYKLVRGGATIVDPRERLFVGETDESEPTRHVFAVDLEELRGLREYGGRVVLDFLYYPNLTRVSLFLNGEPATFPLSVFSRRDAFMIGGKYPRSLAIHNLEVAGLPERGLLEVRAEFLGSVWGNRLSLLFLCGIMAFVLFSYRKRRAGRRARRAEGAREDPAGLARADFRDASV